MKLFDLRSLQVRISLYISLGLLLFATASGVLSFNRAYRAAQELQDREMENLVKLVNTEAEDVVSEADAQAASDAVPDDFSEASSPLLSDAGMLSDTQIAETADGQLDELFDNQPMSGQINLLGDGFHTLSAPNNTAQWRIYLHSISRNNRLLIVQSSHYRNTVAMQNAWESLWPLLLMIPFLILVCNITVYRLFRPLHRLTEQVSRQGPRALDRHADNVPSELQPFIDTIRNQFEELEQAHNLNRRFVANAAHQMRTPLTALTLQAEQLHTAATDEQRQEALAALRSSLARHSRLLNSLLAFARSEEPASESHPPLPLAKNLLNLLPDIVLLADNRHQEFTVTRLEDTDAALPERDWRILCQNLLENALKYTPEHGRIELALYSEKSEAVLQIDDSGSGIPPHEYQQVFTPFYRSSDTAVAQGSGLGLAIVQNLVRRYHGDITLSESPLGGLRVILRLPAAEPANH